MFLKKRHLQWYYDWRNIKTVNLLPAGCSGGEEVDGWAADTPSPLLISTRTRSRPARNAKHRTEHQSLIIRSSMLLFQKNCLQSSPQPITVYTLVHLSLNIAYLSNCKPDTLLYWLTLGAQFLAVAECCGVWAWVRGRTWPWLLLPPSHPLPPSAPSHIPICLFSPSH